MYPFSAARPLLIGTAAVLGATFLAGCGKHAEGGPAAADVQVTTVVQRDVPVVREWVGTLDGSVNAQIRAQVTGYVLRQDYREGSFVHQGDLLFEIDPRPFAAALAVAEGQLAQAQAELGKAELDVQRDTPLAHDKVISQEELDNAVQSRLAAEARVATAKASADQARLNLEFARVVSPVDGVAGLVQTQIGDLVGPGTGVLTTVSTIDPIKAYFPITEQAYLEFRRRSGSDAGLPADTRFELVLSDGSVYPQPGTLFAIDRQIESNTGALRVVALFPNPNGLLRPGQFARVRAVVNVLHGALLVPTRALTELQGSYLLGTVDAANVAHLVPVRAGEVQGSLRVVEGALHPGDRVVAEGIQKLKEGAPVHPLPFTPAETSK